MKTTLSLLLACWVLLGAAGRTAADEAEKLLDEAIRAHGGASVLARIRQMLRTSTGVAFLPGGEAKLAERLLTDLPDRVRQELELGPQRVLTVLNGDRGWQVTGGTTQELGKGMLAEYREDAYALYLSTLVPARRERRFALKKVADVEVEGRKAAGVKVSCKGRDDVTLYFDRRTDLLVKVSYSAVQAGLTVEKALLLSDHKDFSGARLPTKIALSVNGTKFIEFKSASYTFPRVDEKSFAKP